MEKRFNIFEHCIKRNSFNLTIAEKYVQVTKVTGYKRNKHIKHKQ